MKFSKKEFLKNAPAWIKRKLKAHVDILDGMDVVFDSGEWGLIPHYIADGQEWCLYPAHKSWCV